MLICSNAVSATVITAVNIHGLVKIASKDMSVRTITQSRNGERGLAPCIGQVLRRDGFPLGVQVMNEITRGTMQVRKALGQGDVSVSHERANHFVRDSAGVGENAIGHAATLRMSGARLTIDQPVGV